MSTLSLLLVMVALAFAPLSTAQEAAESSSRASWPNISAKPRVDVYGSAKLKGYEGRVVITYDLTAEGQVTLFSVDAYDEGQLAYTARDFFKLIKITPPAESPMAPGETRRYTLGMVFCLVPSGLKMDFPPERKIGTWNLIKISGSRIPGAPVRTTLAKGETDKCSSGKIPPHP